MTTEYAPLTRPEMESLWASQRDVRLDRDAALAIARAVESLRTGDPVVGARIDGMQAVLLLVAREPDFYRDGDLNERYNALRDASPEPDAFVLGWNLGLNIAGGR